MDIRNKTPRPIQVPLSQGSVLRLGPRMVGQISDKDIDSEDVQKMIAEGVIEVADDGGSKGYGSGPPDPGLGPSEGGEGGGSSAHRPGDR